MTTFLRVGAQLVLGLEAVLEGHRDIKHDGYCDTDTGVAACVADADSFLPKPVDFDQLSSTLEHFSKLRRRVGQAQMRERNFGARRALVVDDDNDLAASMSAMLEIHHYEVCTVGDGFAALAVLDNFTPDAAILDVRMPAVDGLRAAVELKQALPDIVIVGLSGLGEQEDRLRAIHAGFDAYFTKPCDFGEVCQALDQRLACFDPSSRRRWSCGETAIA